MHPLLSSHSGGSLAVLGASSCFGDWAVLAAEKRSATLRCLTECDVLEIDAYNFLRAVEPKVQAALRRKRQLVEEGGQSLASATQTVEEEQRRQCQASDTSLFGIIRKPKHGTPEASRAMGDSQATRAEEGVPSSLGAPVWTPLKSGRRGDNLRSDTASEFFEARRDRLYGLGEERQAPTPPLRACGDAMSGVVGAMRLQRASLAATTGETGLPRQRSNSCPPELQEPTPPLSPPSTGGGSGAVGRSRGLLRRQRSRSVPRDAERRVSFPPVRGATREE